MKFFGWGRKKDPPPIRSEGFKLQCSDVARAPEYGSVEDQPWSALKELSGEDSALVDHLDGAETWEERLQEKIRFVFGHEQEGLLAIGTFALDQLVTSHITDHKLPPPPAIFTDHHMSTSSSSSTDTTVIHEVQSSDGEAESTDDSSGSTTTRTELMSDYPVFGDPGSITARSSALCPHDDHKLTSCSHSPTKHVLDQSVDSDQEFHNAGPLCGLFRSRRSVHKRRKPLKKKDSTKGASLGKQLGRLWRSRCSTGATHVSARVSPEKDTCLSDPPQTQGPPCIANCMEESASEVGELRKRRSCPSFGNLGWASCAHNGNWIRTDSEWNDILPGTNYGA